VCAGVRVCTRAWMHMRVRVVQARADVRASKRVRFPVRACVRVCVRVIFRARACACACVKLSEVINTSQRKRKGGGGGGLCALVCLCLCLCVCVCVYVCRVCVVCVCVCRGGACMRACVRASERAMGKNTMRDDAEALCVPRRGGWGVRCGGVGMGVGGTIIPARSPAVWYHGYDSDRACSGSDVT
jgi:hypothetical protein